MANDGALRAPQVLRPPRPEDDVGPSAALDEVEELASVALLTIDATTGVHRWSSRLHDLLGTLPGRVTPDDAALLEAVEGDDRPRVSAALRSAARADRTGPVPFRVPAPARGTRHLSLSTRLRRGEGGAPLTVVGVISDVTEQVRAEEALRVARTTTGLVEELAHVGTWVFDLWTTKVTWSDGLYRIHGVDPRTFAPDPTTTLQLVHAADRERIHRHHLHAATDGRVEPMRYRIVRPDGSERTLIGCGYLERTAEELPARLVGAVLDVTERRHLEELLSRAQRLESIGRFAGGVAHDFNNLMSVILLSTALAARATTDERAAKALAEAEAAATRAGAMTRQILSFADRRAVVPVAVDVGRVMTELRRIFEPLLGERVELSLEVAPDLGLVLGEASQLEQIAMNLLVNARDAMPDGGRVALRLYNETRDREGAEGPSRGPHVVMEVTDTGEGMAPHVRARLFEPFFTTKEPGRGTGLGLPTVQAIVHQLGGVVEVTSERGAGSTFRVLLPRAGDEPAPAPPKRAGRPRGGSEALLLVEDDEALRQATAFTLRDLGYDVVAVRDAEAALRELDAGGRRIRALLTDVVLPRMDGITLARAFVERDPTIGVLLLSGYAPPPATDGALFPMLAKPYLPGDLARVLRAIVGADDDAPAEHAIDA